MEVSPNVLRRETLQLLNRVNAEIAKFEEESEKLSLSPFQVQDPYGNVLYASLVTSKIMALNTLALLNENRR